ncbi:MAG: nitroreductase family protein [Bacteroidales bacterium]|jgi:nitroreductase|nr:nitroreductase family protein [Bacteroidales bacterium]
MLFKDLVYNNRSYRRYDESYKITKEQLLAWVDLARHTPSARNAQPLKFFVSAEAETNQLIFDHISWAGYLENGRPVQGERPSAYIVLCNDGDISQQSLHDQGIMAQTILLAAVSENLGGCMFTSVKREELRKGLNLPQNLEPQLVIAIGKPVEHIVITEVKDSSIRYYRDADNTHFVPKRALADLVIN